MKVIIATGIFPPDIGGPATYSKVLADYLARHGNEVAVLTFGSSHSSSEYILKKVSRKWPKGLKHIVYFFKLWVLAKKADVIFSQNATSVGLPAYVVSKIIHKKLITKVVIDANIEVARIDRGSRMRRMIQKFVVQRSDIVIVPSEYLRKVVGAWGVDENQIKVVYNGVEPFPDVPEKNEAKRIIGISGDIVLSVGRLVAGKGFKTLIKIFPRILDVNPLCKLVIVGDGYEFSELKKMVNEAYLSDKIFIVGRKTPQELIPYYKAADIFILNTFSEGFSHVLLEALAAGIPVITTKVGGNPEIITDGIHGLMVTYNDEDALVESIKRIYNDEELRKKLSESGLTRSKDFGVSRMITETVKILSHV